MQPGNVHRILKQGRNDVTLFFTNKQRRWNIMRFIFFIVLLGFICFTSAQDEDCCELFVYRARKSIQERVTSYRIQEFEGPHCFSGVVFKWGRRLEFCSDPKLKWVQDLMKRVDGLSEGSSVRRNVRSASRFRRSEQP